MDEPTDPPQVPSFGEMQMETGMFSGTPHMSQASEKAKPVSLWHPMPPIAPDADMNLLLQQDTQYEDMVAQLIAGAMVLSFESAHQFFQSIPNMFLSPVMETAMEQDGNEFIWEYQVEDPETGYTFEISTRATASGNQAQWVMIAELDHGDHGFAEQQILDGTSSLDGATGDWHFTLEMDGDPRSFDTRLKWDFEGENLNAMDLELSMTDARQSVYGIGTYELDGETARITNARVDVPNLDEISAQLPVDVDLRETFTVHWDLQTESGSITIDNQEFSW